MSWVDGPVLKPKDNHDPHCKTRSQHCEIFLKGETEWKRDALIVVVFCRLPA
jgi:hypothetical protein